MTGAPEVRAGGSRSGLLPADQAPRPTGRWLKNSGHGWKVVAANLMFAAPTVALLCTLAAHRFARGDEYLWIRSASGTAVFISFALFLAAGVLRGMVRCRVCGLHLSSSVEARLLGARKWAWIAGLDECPVCRDDGTAMPESRSRWEQSGGHAEEPYWSWNRVILAVVILALGWVAATFLMDFTSSRAFPKHTVSSIGASPK